MTGSLAGPLQEPFHICGVLLKTQEVHQNYVPPDSVYCNVDKAERKAD